MGGVTATVKVAMTVSTFSSALLSNSLAMLRLHHYQTALQWPLLAAFSHGQKGSKRSASLFRGTARKGERGLSPFQREALFFQPFSRAGFRMLGSAPSSSGGARQLQPEQVYVDIVAQRLCAIAASSSRKRLLFVTGAGMSGMTCSCSPPLNYMLLFCRACVGLRVRPPLYFIFLPFLTPCYRQRFG